ncbi:Lrp/AsnC family transcriptional regulator [Lutimaribacter sp. EGI FJ00015]|uniref:Lrp/AsnC family transcriptional regulator n=1 Tax=Lutimaribacter degradans TaxID=2945989 RepID=A0ACC5ZTP8_9RHOB|nr:Lrp/AsnC family transcriptional regulator [Lutimaribacter sp. EGI FJ00013]MCM2560934.1 Lrp/AsnC family transcriptional regulator [Lutimaribacter sp. EGI FJ00013]MCO0612120.1 Lrp/AsnC family transcriptional regulator [Lutimaribacter sp. EGI FJ00015]MCO0634760.1 Lrp/AsnC family transcriptional regulator [Lutimaribacter sp. EGI FJ00014]
MDDLDHALIRALRQDARAPLSSLSALLGVSRATVRARIDKLRQSGEIVGFTVLLKGDVARDPVRGLMMLGIEGRGADRIKRQLAGLPQVQAVHATNGRWDLIVELGTETLAQLDGVLNAIRRFDGVATSETSLLLSTVKSGG